MASGFKKVVAIDAHSDFDKKSFPIPLISVSSASLFAKDIKDGKDFAVIAPDYGAIKRARSFARTIGSRKFGYFNKIRSNNGAKHLEFHGGAGRRAAVVDDMLDTGSTLISCVSKLKKMGVKDIRIFVAHGLFTGDKWTKLFKLGVQKIYCADTVIPPKISAKIAVRSVAGLISDSISGR